MDLGLIKNVATFLMGAVILVLFATSYLYIHKLESIGCACANHPYRNFIKGYTIFGFLFILVSMFLPHETLFANASGPAAIVMGVVSLLFLISIVVFFFTAIEYVRYLVREKCKCSEDIRREVLYYWSIVHLVYLAIMVLAGIFLSVLSGFWGVVVSTLDTSRKNYGKTLEAVTHPLKNVDKVPATLKKLVRGRK